MTGHERRPWGWLTTTLLLVLAGCMPSEVRGTYDVEIEIARVAYPLEGTLIISSSILDVPSPSEEERAIPGDWFAGDAIDANSCFILHSDSDSSEAPLNVRLFQARIRASEIDVPIEIYRTPVQRIEILSLDFFANAIGGDVVLHDRGQQRPGRIHGTRKASPSPRRCLDALASFRAQLRSSLAP